MELLVELKVRDLGIIEEIDWKLGCGLNVITGETGAGKSLVIDAVETLLGSKVDEEIIRHGATEALIEGVFSFPPDGYIKLVKLLSEKGLQDKDSLIIRCEIHRQGRSTTRVNGQAVPRGLLQQIGRFLVDIHGQSEHLSLLDRKYHLDFLDYYAHTTGLRENFSEKVERLRKTEHELKSLIEEEKDLARREEFLRFQIEEIRQARLREGEDSELERERNILTSIEQLKELSYEIYQALHGDEPRAPSALGKLNEAVPAMKKLADFDPALKSQLGFLEETLYGLEELARDIRAYSDKLEYDPNRLEEVESRLDLIRSLKRKYGQTTVEILAYLAKAEKQLEGISYSSRKRVELEQMLPRLKEEMGTIAGRLSQARSKAAKKLANEVKKELRDLNMSQVEFEVSLTRTTAEDGIPLAGGSYSFNHNGVDNIEFMVSTNPGEPLKPLSRIASTGEMSRFMLALKGTLSQADNIPVLVFDEIDVGIGGRSGEMIGKKLWLLAQNRQVICVTHLPQIAVFADAHYCVHKEISKKRTVSRLEPLEKESRVKELAMMLTGKGYTETALKSARELSQAAEEWKKGQGR